MNSVIISWLLFILIKVVSTRIWFIFTYCIYWRTLITNGVFFETTFKQLFLFLLYQWNITFRNLDYKNIIFFKNLLTCIYACIYVCVCIQNWHFFFTKGHKKYMHLFYGRYYLRFFIINLMCNMCVSILLLTIHWHL